jgi:two-component system OmpR family response regulator
MRVLIVEDDPVLSDGLMRSLGKGGYAVDRVDTGTQADQLLAVHPYDLVILDLGLPGMSGMDVLRRMRIRRSTTPVLILTARDSTEDRVIGLDAGADDYLPKPFDLEELEARLRALLRRGRYAGASLVKHGQLTLDLAGRRATVNGEPVDLSARELAVLEALLLSAGRVVSKDQLVEMIFTTAEDVGGNAIEVYVHRLRKKVEHAGVEIRTIRGLGYLIDKQLHD